MPHDTTAIGPHPTDTGAPALSVERGVCYVLFAYDIGLAADLDLAQRLITEIRERGPLRHQRRTPYYFDYQPAPLRILVNAPSVQIGGFATEPTVGALLYDFGALSVQYTVPLHGPLSDLLAL